MDIYSNLITAWKVPEADFKDARTEARTARIACGYDPARCLVRG